MTIRQSDRKTPSAEYGNCITNERDNVQSRVSIEQVKNKLFEVGNIYIVTPIQPRGVRYKRVKEGEVVPEGAIIHTGKI